MSYHMATEEQNRKPRGLLFVLFWLFFLPLVALWIAYSANPAAWQTVVDVGGYAVLLFVLFVLPALVIGWGKEIARRNAAYKQEHPNADQRPHWDNKP